MINLNDYVERVWAATTLEEKQARLREMIGASHATVKTKKLTLLQIAQATSCQRLDKLASNYSLSGMGMKVI
jgi:hypothetical protein